LLPEGGFGSKQDKALIPGTVMLALPHKSTKFYSFSSRDYLSLKIFNTPIILQLT
jgi:hypothetical protein